MSPSEHLIVYAAPVHDPIPAVECSCGWSVTGEHAEGGAHRDVLQNLLDQWLSHIAQESGS